MSISTIKWIVKEKGQRILLNSWRDTDRNCILLIKMIKIIFQVEPSTNYLWANNIDFN
jgi:hypothetical protein